MLSIRVMIMLLFTLVGVTSRVVTQPDGQQFLMKSRMRIRKLKSSKAGTQLLQETFLAKDIWESADLKKEL